MTRAPSTAAAMPATARKLRCAIYTRKSSEEGLEQKPSLLRGLVFGADGRAMSPSHTRGKRGQIYRHYVSQSVLKGGAGDGPAIARVPAGEIEALVLAQVKALLRQPEVVVGTWRTAGATLPGITEAEVVAALEHFAPLWDELFPAEQERIVRLLVERVVVSEAGAEITLKLDGIAGLARDLMSRTTETRRAA